MSTQKLTHRPRLRLPLRPRAVRAMPGNRFLMPSATQRQLHVQPPFDGAVSIPLRDEARWCCGDCRPMEALG
jgi:hypothetical protein